MTSKWNKFNLDVNGIGQDNWIKYHFNGNRTRVNPKDNFEVTFTKKATSTPTFNAACKLVAEELYELNRHQTIFVPMSGGCDSETVADTFMQLKIPFTPIIHEVWSLGLQLTYADSWWAYRWCKKHNITPVVKHTTTLEMFADVKPLIDKIKGRKLYPAQNIILSEFAVQHGGIVINGQAFPEYYPDYTLEYLIDIINDSGFFNEDGTKKSGWLLHEDDFYVDMYNPGYHTYNFLSWSPEIVLAYIKERDMSLNSEENKFKIMKKDPRPKIGAPDAVWHLLKEYQHILKKKYGTSELSFIGTHEEMFNILT
jgi:hypothetical protein